MQNKLLGRLLGGALLLAAASGLMAQDTDQSSYQGPGISSPGWAMSAGAAVNKWTCATTSAFQGSADTAIAPFAIDSHGNLIRIPALYGIEVNGGVYGVHRWKRSQLGLDYAGSYTKYFNSDFYNSTDHSLALGYTDQISQAPEARLARVRGKSYDTALGQAANATSERPQFFLHSGNSSVRHSHLLPPVVRVRNLVAIRTHVL